MKPLVCSGVVLATLALVASNAFAQSRPEGRTWFQDRVAAPSSALELAVATGYTQGFGMLRGGTSIPDVATAGVGFDLGVGYRMSPRWALGLNGQYHELYAPHASGARGMTGGIAATYHFDPEARLDPWLELGTGYRLLWEDRGQQPNMLSHGFQLARARVGLDMRLAPEIAIAPAVGADANVFLWQDGATTTAIAEPRVNMFVFAGLLGRFDFGATTGGPPVVAARAPAVPPPMAEAPTTTITSAPIEETVPVSPTISVSEEILRACNLHFDSVAKAPKFEFDKSSLQPADHATLDQIAACVVTGPLKGRTVRLVGHADPRGTSEYNMKLGARRAKSVAAFLESAGVDATFIQQTSRGELDAKGTDEAAWAIDRRVDIVLAE